MELTICSGAIGSPGSADLVAGGEDRDARAAMHRKPRLVAGGRQPDVACRAGRRPRGHQFKFLEEILAGAADMPAGPHRLAHRDVAAGVVGVLLDDDRIGAVGNGAPVKMRTASPGPSVPGQAMAGGRGAHDAQPGARGDVGGAHRVAVHGRDVERRLG